MHQYISCTQIVYVSIIITKLTLHASNCRTIGYYILALPCQDCEVLGDPPRLALSTHTGNHIVRGSCSSCTCESCRGKAAVIRLTGHICRPCYRKFWVGEERQCWLRGRDTSGVGVSPHTHQVRPSAKRQTVRQQDKRQDKSKLSP